MSSFLNKVAGKMSLKKSVVTGQVHTMSDKYMPINTCLVGIFSSEKCLCVCVYVFDGFECNLLLNSALAFRLNWSRPMSNFIVKECGLLFNSLLIL